MKRVLVTGANKGIGRAIVAAVLAQADDTFALLGSRDAGRGLAAKQALVAEHPGWEERIHVLAVDVSDDASVAQAAAEVKAKFSDEATPLYGIVNNAGIGVGMTDLGAVLDVNVFGIHRVCTTFLPLLAADGRVVNVTSASGPIFVNGCSEEQQAFFRDASVTWDDIVALLKECLSLDSPKAFAARGLSDGSAYGLSKAFANSHTMMFARENPTLLVNACTPGFIETDLSRSYAVNSGQTPAEMGMKSPDEGAKSTMFLLFGEPQGSGHYYGSDGVRSPLDRYRGPGDPPYDGH